MSDKAKGKGFHDERYRSLMGKLVQARKSKALSQEALASLLNRHQQFVSRYEIGERRLDIVEFVDVAKALGLDASALIKSL